MSIRVLALVYLFLIRLRFPFYSSVTEIIRKRYGGAVVAKIRKYEKLDFRIGKGKLDISFLEVCAEKDVMPNFVSFRTANMTLRRSGSYINCQRLLLKEELGNKNAKLVENTQNLHSLKVELLNLLSMLDFLYITSLFLDKNYKALKQVESTQNSKLSKLMEDNPRHTADALIYNFSSHNLTSSQQSILMKGLNFSLPPKSLKMEDYFLNFELLFRGVECSQNIREGDRENFNLQLCNIAYSSLRYYNRRKKKLDNISEEEFNALKELMSLDDIIIQKAD